MTAVGLRAQEPKRVWVLDKQRRTLTVLEASSGTIVDTVALPAEPEDLLPPIHGRVVVLNRIADGKTSVTVVRSDSLQVVSHLPICDGVPGQRAVYVGGMRRWRSDGWGLDGVLPSPDGSRVTFVCPGSTKGDVRSGELATLDLESATVKGRLPISIHAAHTAGGWPFLRTRLIPLSGDLAVVFSQSLKNGAVPATLIFVNLAGPDRLDSLRLAGTPIQIAASQNFEHLYLLGGGQLQIVSTLTRSVVGGQDAVWSSVNDSLHGRILFLGKATGDTGTRAPGELIAIRGAEVEGRVRIAPSPRLARISPDGTLLLVAGAESLSVVDLNTLERAGAVQLASPPTELVLRGAKAFVSKRTSSPKADHLVAIDIATGTVLTSIEVGPKAPGWERLRAVSPMRWRVRCRSGATPAVRSTKCGGPSGPATGTATGLA